MTSAEVSARRRVGKGGGHRASRERRASRVEKSNENGAIVRRSGMTYRLVSASKARLRVDRSASEMPFRSRWMLARNAAASVASPIARVRPGARSQSTEPTNVPDRKTTSATRRRRAVTARQRRFRVSERGRRFQKRAKSVGAARPHGGPTSRRAEHARTDRGAREASAVRTAEGTASVGGVAVFRVWRNGRRDEVGGRDVRFGRGR